MTKEIEITAKDLLTEKFSRQEMHTIASTMLDRLYNESANTTTGITYESFLEWRKPYPITDDSGKLIGIGLPEINKMMLPELLNDRKADSWDNMMQYAKDAGAELVSHEEGRCIQTHWEEIKKILKKYGCKEVDLDDGVWSKEKSQYSASGSWYWYSTRWYNNNYKSSSNVGLAVCALPR